MSAPQQPSAGGRATRWTISGGWRDGDQQFAGTAVDPAATDLPEVAVEWVENEGEPYLMVAAWDYGLAVRTHARLWEERRASRRA